MPRISQGLSSACPRIAWLVSSTRKFWDLTAHWHRHDYFALLKAIALHIQSSTHLRLQRLFSTDRFSDPPARSLSSIATLAGHLIVTLPTDFLISQPSRFASSWTAHRFALVSRFPSHNILLSFRTRAACSVSDLIEPNYHRAISTP